MTPFLMANAFVWNETIEGVPNGTLYGPCSGKIRKWIDAGAPIVVESDRTGQRLRFKPMENLEEKAMYFSPYPHPNGIFLTFEK